MQDLPSASAVAGAHFDPSAAVPIRIVEDTAPVEPGDPGSVMTTCANCGATMIERKCKLICRCGYFLSCSDYY
jgi:hypothetical protein